MIKYFFLIIFFFVLIFKNFILSLYYKYNHNLRIQNIFSYMYVYKEIFIDKDYIFFDKIKFNKNINEIYFDVGGNNGLYSLYLNDNYDNIEVHVFEPIIDLYKNIKWNIGKNKKSCNTFYINNFGLGNKYEKLQINFMPNADGLSTIKNDIKEKKNHITNTKCKKYNNKFIKSSCRNIMNYILNDNTLKVDKRDIEIIRVSDYIKKNNINFIDKIKVDIEGYELEFLLGIDQEDFSKIGSLILEVENYRSGYSKKIIDLLESNNFLLILPKNIKNNWIMIYAINKLYYNFP